MEINIERCNRITYRDVVLLFRIVKTINRFCPFRPTYRLSFHNRNQELCDTESLLNMHCYVNNCGSKLKKGKLLPVETDSLNNSCYVERL